jgi:hypothetical protein
VPPHQSPAPSPGSSSPTSEAMIAAARRFRESWELTMERGNGGEVLTDREIVEMHEAALALIWATGTTNLNDALDLLHRFESDRSP